MYTTTIIRIWHWFIQILLSWKQSLHVCKHQIKHCLILQFPKQILFLPWRVYADPSIRVTVLLICASIFLKQLVPVQFLMDFKNFFQYCASHRQGHFKVYTSLHIFFYQSLTNATVKNYTFSAKCLYFGPVLKDLL